uniref:Uncharacterized protein LOC8275559 isoform X1 n=1 Tax=Rhizophora mucronata TaxID=61149 RepID=A0A2P2LA00_RHIMU
METIQDLIEEAKLRALWWAVCIFAVTYFLSHTSSSMWMNLPISILLAVALRVLFNEVEFKRKPQTAVRPQSYLSHLEKKQMSVNDSRLSSAPPPPRWKRKIDSPIVEAAINEFMDMVLKDFVVDLWYSEITPDKEAPELMRSVIMDALGEISARVKEINLVDLLTRDIVDLIGDHLDLFRRNQASIGVDVMGTLSTEERDDRLKYHLMVSKELHPALISPESEYKFLQRIVGGVIALVLRPREAQCPLVRTIARELVTCLVLQPVMNLVSPVYINQVIESILVAIKDGSMEEGGGERIAIFDNKRNYQGTGMTSANIDTHGEKVFDHSSYQKEALQPRPADWARLLEAATQRRAEVLTPENLENMWTKGRNYKKKENKIVKAGVLQPLAKSRETLGASPVTMLGKELLTENTVLSTRKDDRAVNLRPRLSADSLLSTLGNDGKQFTQDEELPFERERANHEIDSSSNLTLNENRTRLKRSNSASALKALPDNKKVFTGQVGGPIISEFYSADIGRHNEDHNVKNVSDIVIRNEGHHLPKLKCRVMGAYFEKLGSKSFAVYSIAVTDAENRTWFVKRRFLSLTCRIISRNSTSVKKI